VRTSELWEELQTGAGRERVEAYREELRGNVRRVASIARTVLEEYRRNSNVLGKPQL
jgi:hypothetical protein